MLASIFFAGAIFCLLFGIIPIVCLFVGSCWLFIAFAKDLTNELLGLDASARDKNYPELMERFTKLVEMHMNIKQLSSNPFQFVFYAKWHFFLSFIICILLEHLLLIKIQGCRWIWRNFRVFYPRCIHVDVTNGLLRTTCISRTISWVYMASLSFLNYLEIVEEETHTKEQKNKTNNILLIIIASRTRARAC